MSATFRTDSLSSATTGGAVKVSRALVAVDIPSAFSGTVKFKWTDEGGTAHTVQENGTDLSFTAAGERVLDFGVPVSLYGEVTAYTSGTVRITITGARFSYP